MTPFAAVESGIECRFTPEERRLLVDVVPMLEGLGPVDEDPAARRLTVPVYLDDATASDEWRRLVEGELAAARRSDRDMFTDIAAADGPVIVSEVEAAAFLRVVNEARLALAARLGVESEGDLDGLGGDERRALDYLGWVLGELTSELSRSL